MTGETFILIAVSITAWLITALYIIYRVDNNDEI